MKALKKILFVDRDGTLIEEPADQQIDALTKLRLLPGVIPALLKLSAAGYRLVMVSNQDGLGSASFPTAAFELPQYFLLDLLASQGITFDAIHIDPHFEHENAPTRKPGIGMLLDYLRAGDLDFARSAVIGDRETDLQLARNLGVRGFRLGPDQWNWQQIAHLLVDQPRTAQVERVTSETRIKVSVDLDREAPAEVATGIGFFDHMLEQLGRHGGFALTLVCAGDPQIDDHHSVEDCGLALGSALRQALGDKRGIARYGFTLPMDEALAEAVLDLSGRALLVFDGHFERPMIGELATEMVPHFFRSLCDGLGANLHLKVRGDNTHHQIEACFKVVARALGLAMRRVGEGVPSTKGSL
ncbi:MAG: bifunctional histidinol-phosphatase/imidazoleglycerol-phosphate dehydratase [Lysobacterales bacterium CG02_land_8_20_14_3_00_62_12]|nr:MAG: bifunctional histidinol-phosphatase/imidazoleglycerol-phosphate dehydratase [Xanthomonadales bacterium CG02_land_8_20_14_3_00_62_12]